MLEHKIYEMEKFLADYGLIWVGDENNNSSEPGSTSNDYIKTCYAQLTANIEELNLAVGKGEVHVHHNQDGGSAMFKVLYVLTATRRQDLSFVTSWTDTFRQNCNRLIQTECPSR